MHLNFVYRTPMACALFLACILDASAEIIIHGTRVIYSSDAREVTVQLSNNGDKPSLVQIWLDHGDAAVKPEQLKVPFIVSPAMTRVESGKGQVLRITALPSSHNLSTTQESLFWLNVLDIPPRPLIKPNDTLPENYLQLAIRSRIKFIYRPHFVKGTVVEAAAKINWQRQGDELIADNPTPFFMSITSIDQYKAGQKLNIVEQGLMLAPYSQQRIKLNSKNISNMTFDLINDYGNRIEKEIKF